MTLFIPQWQGAGKRYSIVNSIKKLKELYFPNLKNEIEINLEPSETKKNIKHYDSILKNIRIIKNFITLKNPHKIFLLGGECSTVLMPISFLNKKYQNDLSVLWFDAHGDLNTNKTSISMNFHGMPLRMLFGDGEENIREELPSLLNSDQVIMIGVRDLENIEKDYIERKKIKIIKIEDLKTNPNIIVNNPVKKNLYIHIDLDVLDPDEFQYTVCKSENGITIAELIKIINSISYVHNIVGMSIVEYNDKDNKGINKLNGIIDIGKRVIKDNCPLIKI